MLAPIATQTDALNLGITVSDEALTRASARIRGFLRQQVTSGTSTITGYGPTVPLPQRPVTDVTSVTVEGVAASSWRLRNHILTVDADRDDEVQVTYSHGWLIVPDELVELVCQVASRLDAPSAALAAGVQQQTSGPFTVGYGWDAWKAQADLTAGEKAVLRRYWPSLPRTIGLGAP